MATHLWVRGGSAVDTKARTWSESGAVPRVARDSPRPEGLGPFATDAFLSSSTAGLLDLGTTESATVFAIVKVGASPAATEYVLHNKTTASVASAGVSMELSTTGTRVVCRAADGTGNAAPTSLASTLAPGGLYTLACTMTRSGGNVTVQPFVNGAASGAGAAAALGSVTGGASARLGLSAQTTGPFTGVVYELAVWKRALSPAEIAALHVSTGLF